MSFWTYLGNGFRILLFDKQAVQDIINDPDRKRHAFVLLTILSVLIGLLIGGLGAAFTIILSTQYPAVTWGPGMGFLVGFLGGFLLLFGSTLLGYGITHLLARLFGGTTGILELFTVAMSYTLAIIAVSLPIGVVTLVPLLGILVNLAFTIYSLTVFIFIVREVYRMSTGRAVAVVLLPALIILTLGILAALFFIPWSSTIRPIVPA